MATAPKNPFATSSGTVNYPVGTYVYPPTVIQDYETKELLKQLIQAVNYNTEVCKQIVEKLGSGLD